MYGKTDKFFIKQFEEETNLKTYLVLDASKSMDYASEGSIKKIEYASFVAAALAHLMIEQRDAVGLTIYDNAVRKTLPPRATRTYLKQILTELSLVKAANVTGTAQALDTLAEHIHRRGLVIILSDLFDDPVKTMTAFKHFRHKGNEVVVMQVLDPRERTFAFGSDALFKDMETGETIATQPWHIQAGIPAIDERISWSIISGNAGIIISIMFCWIPQRRSIRRFLNTSIKEKKCIKAIRKSQSENAIFIRSENFLNKCLKKKL